ncbi:hypothetical protein D3C87_2171490 [compost metagenome]
MTGEFLNSSMKVRSCGTRVMASSGALSSELTPSGFKTREMTKPIIEAAMKLNRMVVITTWLPRLACK